MIPWGNRRLVVKFWTKDGLTYKTLLSFDVSQIIQRIRMIGTQPKKNKNKYIIHKFWIRITDWQKIVILNQVFLENTSWNKFQGGVFHPF